MCANWDVYTRIKVYVHQRARECVCIRDVDDPLHMAWLIDVLFFDTARRRWRRPARGCTIPNCIPPLMGFNEVLLHYPNSHFPTTGGGPDPDFRYIHITHTYTRIYSIYLYLYTRVHTFCTYIYKIYIHIIWNWPIPPSLVCGLVLFGHRRLHRSSKSDRRYYVEYYFVQLKMTCTYILYFIRITSVFYEYYFWFTSFHSTTHTIYCYHILSRTAVFLPRLPRSLHTRYT